MEVYFDQGQYYDLNDEDHFEINLLKFYLQVSINIYIILTYPRTGVDKLANMKW